MSISEKVQAVIDSGISPLSFSFEPVRFFSDGDAVIRTNLIINSLDVGMLTFEQYRYVAGRSKQGEALATRHLEKLLRALPTLAEKFPSARCFTVPVFTRMLKDGKLSRLLFDLFAKFPEASPSLVCIEISADVLYEDMEEMRVRISELSHLGVKVALSELGDEYCPIFRLSGVKLDYAFLAEYAVASFSTDDRERVAGNIIKYLHSLGAKVVAPGPIDSYGLENAKELDLDGIADGGLPASEQVGEEDFDERE